jgi:hypothetical protein
MVHYHFLLLHTPPWTSAPASFVSPVNVHFQLSVRRELCARVLITKNGMDMAAKRGNKTIVKVHKLTVQ